MKLKHFTLDCTWLSLQLPTNLLMRAVCLGKRFRHWSASAEGKDTAKHQKLMRHKCASSKSLMSGSQKQFTPQYMKLGQHIKFIWLATWLIASSRFCNVVARRLI